MALKINRNLQRILKIIGWVLLIALIACMIKILVWERNYYGTKSSETRAKADVVITGIDALGDADTTPISAEEIEKYQVEATKPRYLDIKRLGIHARIKESIINSERLATPANIHDVMWYAGSGKPGENGTVLLSGISRFRQVDGAFANLDSLEKDDEIVIETGFGEKHTYAVYEVLIIDAEEAEMKLPSIQRRIDDKETLSLVTAVAKVADSGEYNSIAIVRAIKK